MVIENSSQNFLPLRSQSSPHSNMLCLRVTWFMSWGCLSSIHSTQWIESTFHYSSIFLRIAKYRFHNESGGEKFSFLVSIKSTESLVRDVIFRQHHKKFSFENEARKFQMKKKFLKIAWRKCLQQYSKQEETIIFFLYP